jgi:hypothetical protein
MDLTPPPKPAIIRPAPAELRRDWRRTPAREASFAPGWFPAGAAGPKGESTAFAAAYVTRAQSMAAATSHSFAGIGIGPAHSTRIVVLAIQWQPQVAPVGTETGVSIGGVAASQVATSPGLSPGNNIRCSLYRAAVPTGSTATIAFTTSNTAQNINIAIWRIVNAASAVPSDTATSNAASDGTRTLTIDAPAGGVVIACAGGNSGAFTWSITETYDVNVNLNFTGALYLTPGAAEVNKAITAASGRAAVASAWA